MQEDVPTCECGSTDFSVLFRELLAYPLDASLKHDGWGVPEIVEDREGQIPISITCENCGQELPMTEEVLSFISKTI